MKSRWNQSDLNALTADLTSQGINHDLAIRVYTTRLLGQDPKLVLHGGGNTSVKTTATDAAGTEYSALCVKGSGWDMGSIEPAGLPALELEPLAALAEIDSLSDEALVASQRRLLLDPFAPNPSIEAVLHAIIPHKHVDHTHANAIVSLTNQPDGEAIIRELFPDTTIVPYVMPGFVLAKQIRHILDVEKTPKHMILLKHGIFTFNDDPRQSYDEMIQMCDAAERRLDQGAAKPFGTAQLPSRQPPLEDIAPVIRGALARDSGTEGRLDRWIMDFRTTEQIQHFVDGSDVTDYATRGNATPDHSLRIKRFGMVTTAPAEGQLDRFGQEVRRDVDNFAAIYLDYFERNNARAGSGLTALDPVPRVIYVPRIGLFGVGKTAREAAVCADIGEATVDVITCAEGIGTFTALSEEEAFDIEYWSLEQAKLAKKTEKQLHRQVAIVTGGASGLGLAAASLLKSEGAEVATLDIDEVGLSTAARDLGVFPVVCDVTSLDSVNDAVNNVVRFFGGIDILISNAGAAFQGRLDSVEGDLFRQAFELNFWSHHLMARACVKVMQKQKTGGSLVFNVSKQALNPGPALGPYGTSKSALMALVRQYAIEHGIDGITANAVNADRIRTNLLTDEFVAERAKARGVSPDEYMRGNLIGREVTGLDVAKAFLHLATAAKTTGAILTVDGGNVAAMVR